MNTESIFNKIITVKEAAALAELSPRRVRELCESGKYTAEKREGTWLILKESVVDANSPDIIREQFDDMYNLLKSDERYSEITDYAYDCGQLPASLKDANLMLDYYNHFEDDEDGVATRIDAANRLFTLTGIYICDLLIIDNE